ncbi:phospholipid scramblase 2-like [Pecten maximus]|uniref:phospholipid scramblase 2-like n=1 Tax=Pecten maximus TaxID=6579 RepID=UPI0014590698|nr:phospholipid scramblase 2-like [Pecten maximus]
MEYYDERQETIKNENRRASIMMERQIQHGVVVNQPRQSIVSMSSTTTSQPPGGGGGMGMMGAMMGGGGAGGADPMMDMMRLIRAKKVGQRLRRKSVNPKLDPPPGLEGINDKGFVYVRQQLDMDLKGGCWSSNTYKIWDETEDELFYVIEASSCCCRWFCGPQRQFKLDFYTPSDDLVFTLHRKSCRCDCCCWLDCMFCNNKVYVVDCLNRTLGSIKQQYSLCGSRFDILDSEGALVAKIVGPACSCRCAAESTLEIIDKTGEEIIGHINKKWEGNRDDGINMDHEYFDIHFPEKMDSIEKMLVVGGAFLMNYMYFEMS